jgi:hypothetical protein
MDELEHILKAYAVFEDEVGPFLPSSGFNGVLTAGKFAAKRCTAGRRLKAPFSFYCQKKYSPEVYLQHSKSLAERNRV